MSELEYSIIVPCYNESKNISPLLKAFDTLRPFSHLEVVLVDNGSTDSSPRVIAEQLPYYPFARSIRVDTNQGYGFGVLAGLKAARGTFLGWTHADLQTDPADLVKAIALAKEHDERQDLYIKGFRIGRPIKDQLFTACMSIIESCLFQTRLSEINAQPNLFHRQFFEKWHNPPHDFSLDLYAFVLAKRLKLDIVRFPVHFPERQFGVSHWNTDFKSKLKAIRRTLDYSFDLRKHFHEVY